MHGDPANSEAPDQKGLTTLEVFHSLLRTLDHLVGGEVLPEKNPQHGIISVSNLSFLSLDHYIIVVKLLSQSY